MKILLLNGHGINLRVDGAKLFITDGRFSTNSEPLKYIFSPRKIDVEHIVVYGRNGNITIDAIRWLVKHGVQISILNWNGKLLTTMLPAESVQVKTKLAQYSTYGSSEREKIARLFLVAKFEHTQNVLNYLKTRYPQINNDFSKEIAFFRKAKTISEMMMVEGRIASFYWQELTKIFPEKYEFETREYQKRPRGAGDVINCLLNYGYAILEAECLKAINTAGLDAHVGFLHEMNMGKNSLAYDLQEPFRFLIDMAVIQLIESRTLEKTDFIRTETYTLRLRPNGAKKLTKAIEDMLNRKVSFLGQNWGWRYVISEKTTHLAHYLIGKRKNLDFVEPNEVLHRLDNEEIRKKETERLDHIASALTENEFLSMYYHKEDTDSRCWH